jgi:hypothetical protein
MENIQPKTTRRNGDPLTREPINVAASVIADVSAGIYRSPAGAIKELLSNAFDADAKTVRASTGWPEFRTFTCTDDGSGITSAKFKQIMTHIGGSTKRDAGEVSASGRPLIGRIGIGILSIAQICRRFTVISSVAGQPTKFQAKIDLEPFLLAEARRTKLGQSIETETGRIRIGEYEIEETEDSRDAHYTRIVMEHIDAGFRQRLRDVPQIRGGLTPKRFTKGTMEDYLSAVESGTVAEHGAYAQMIWELAITAPVEYLDEGPVVDAPAVAYLRERHARYGFKAYVDGVELRKPIRLPPRPVRSIEHRIYPIRHEKKLPHGRTLRVNGYLHWQKGRVLPRELQGILVRVRNVAVGAYDPTYLGYPHHEGWKFSQMSGEVYVDDGLDQAVNIDRASFRESDDGFIELQGFLFERLKGGADEGAGIFTSIKAETKKLSQKKRQKEEARKDRVAARLLGSKAKQLRVVATPEREAPSGVAFERDSVVVSEEILTKVQKKHRRIFVAICAMLEQEIDGAVAKGRRRLIYERLAKLFAEL